MAERIWDGRCEDCYDRKPLRQYNGVEFLPGGISAELCDDCAMTRMRDCESGREPAPIGLLIAGEWRDAGHVRLCQDGKEIVVAVKYLADGENAGLGRLRFEGDFKWLSAGCFIASAASARSSVRTFLRTFYFPHARLEFLPAE